MTPEDVKVESNRLLQRRKAAWDSFIDLDPNHFIGDNSIIEKLSSTWKDRTMKWDFNEFHDGANYTVGEYRFWFKLTKGGAVKVGYEHRSPVAGTNQSVPWSYPLGEFKNIKSLEQIDAIFGFASPDYK